MFDAGEPRALRHATEAEVPQTRTATTRFALSVAVCAAVVVLRLTYVFC